MKRQRPPGNYCLVCGKRILLSSPPKALEAWTFVGLGKGKIVGWLHNYNCIDSEEIGEEV